MHKHKYIELSYKYGDNHISQLNPFEGKCLYLSFYQMNELDQTMKNIMKPFGPPTIGGIAIEPYKDHHCIHLMRHTSEFTVTARGEDVKRERISSSSLTEQYEERYVLIKSGLVRVKFFSETEKKCLTEREYGICGDIWESTQVFLTGMLLSKPGTIRQIGDLYVELEITTEKETLVVEKWHIAVFR